MLCNAINRSTENRTWGIFEEQIQNTKTGTTALKSNNAHVIAMELWEELIKVSNLFINI